MKKERHERGYYSAEEKEYPIFLVNNPWPYRGGRWRQFKDYQSQSDLIVNHVTNETKCLAIGGNIVFTGEDGFDHTIEED